jgi:hypothetical protein
MSLGDWADSLGESTWDNFIANTDPTIGTCDKNVAGIRTSLPFADLILTFPVTDKNAKIRLPAFLGNHSETFNPSWRPNEVYGRNDPIPIYSNTTRNISLSFQVPNHDSEDANENLRKLNRIIQNLYPLYKEFPSKGKLLGGKLAPNLAIVGAPLVRVKFANLICNSDKPTRGLLGYINNLNVSLRPENGYFMASSFMGVGDQPTLFPRMLDFSFSFNVLHEHLIGWKQSGKWLGKKRSNFPYKSKFTPGDVMGEVGEFFGADSGGVMTNMFGT